jgi:16S rRNA processing protein RimM
MPLALNIKKQIKDNLYIASVANIKTREDAENLKGIEIYVSSLSMPKIDENEYYYHDLIGCFVFDQDNNEKGVVSCVHNFGAGDVLEITKDDKTFFCPFHAVTPLDEKNLLIPGVFFVE